MYKTAIAGGLTAFFLSIVAPIYPQIYAIAIGICFGLTLELLFRRS